MKLKSVWTFVLLTITLAACAVPATPTTIPTTPEATPLPSPLLGTRWELDRMIVNGEIRTKLEFHHSLEFTWSNQLHTDDGCNTVGAPVIFSTSDHSFEFGYSMYKTVVLCLTVDPKTGESIPAPVDEDYIDAVISSATYDIIDDELWLYYPESKANALVYKLIEKVPPPTEEPEAGTSTAAPSGPKATLLPASLLGTRWKLDRMLIEGKPHTDLEFNHYLEFSGDNELWTDSGCIAIIITLTMPLFEEGLASAEKSWTTLEDCSTTNANVDPGEKRSVPSKDSDYVDAIYSAVNCDLRDNELWLYYPDNKANALVYKLIEKVPPPTPTSSAIPSMALINGTLIDGTGADPIKDAVLIIQGERIVAVGPRSSINILAGAHVIDVQGATMLPGFFNAHVHGAYDEEKLAAWAKEGITTVRDLGAYQWPPSQPPLRALLDRIEKDNRYARLVSGGIFITPPGGYPIAVFGGNGKTISTTEEAPPAVNQLLDQGADVIKISLESGEIFRQSIPMLTPDQVKAIVATAHQRGTRVSAHATVSKDLQRAIDEGVDDVAHMVVDPLPDKMIKAMIDRDMVWEPTIELWKNVGQGQDTNVIDNLRRYVAAGGKVALGTDFEGYSTPFQLGMPMKEIAWMSEAGMTPMQIIVAATQNAAHVSNLEKDLGTLEAGKIADVLIVKGDPLQDLKALSNVQYVIHNGEVIRNP